MSDKTDAKKILTAFPLWRTGGDHQDMTPWYYVDEDYPTGPESNNLSLNEAIDMAQNRPLWRLMSTFGTMHY